jgi:hypothetical protein
MLYVVKLIPVILFIFIIPAVDIALIKLSDPACEFISAPVFVCPLNSLYPADFVDEEYSDAPGDHRENTCTHNGYI